MLSEVVGVAAINSLMKVEIFPVVDRFIAFSTLFEIFQSLCTINCNLKRVSESFKS